MKSPKILLITILLGALFTLSSCQTYKSYEAMSFDYFDTVTTIVGYEKNQKAFNERFTMIDNALKKYHRLYDIYYEYENLNNLCTINKNAGIKSVEVDQEIINLVKYGIKMYQSTNGMMNIAMGSVLKLWHDAREKALADPLNAKIPAQDDLLLAQKHMDINKVIIDEEKSTIYLEDALMSLDVGALAKGYATEQVAKMLEDQSLNSYVLNVGGNIRLIGSKPHDELWHIGIQNYDLTSDNDNLATLALKDLAIVTSGSYQRYFEVNGIRYHHIIDPVSLMPKNDYVSISVIAKDAGLADALSTALFNIDIEQGKTIIEQFSDVYVMWVSSSGQITYSNQFTDFMI